MDWNVASGGAFRGTGSMGNGGAMRANPVGAYFAEGDDEHLVLQARRSAIPTHLHPEGIAGAIAIAVAAATAIRTRDLSAKETAKAIFESVLRLTPKGATAERIQLASMLPANTPLREAVQRLGNGSRVTAPDTVAFCLWSATHNLDSYPEAILQTISGRGDSDTNAAIVGGIVALRVGLEGIPQEWRLAREQFSLFH